MVVIWGFLTRVKVVVATPKMMLIPAVRVDRMPTFSGLVTKREYSRIGRLLLLAPTVAVMAQTIVRFHYL